MYISPNTVIAALKPLTLQLFKEHHGCPLLSFGFCAVCCKAIRQVLSEGAELRQWLFFPVVGEFGRIAPNDFLYGVFGQLELPGYLSDRLAVPVVSTTNLTDGFHYQHLLSSAPLSG